MKQKLLASVLLFAALLLLFCSCIDSEEGGFPNETTAFSEKTTEAKLTVMKAPDGFVLKREDTLSVLAQLYPEYAYDEAKPTYSYALEDYKAIYTEKLTFKEVVDRFGVPYDCSVYGSSVLQYFTSDNGTVYIIPRINEKLYVVYREDNDTEEPLMLDSFIEHFYTSSLNSDVPLPDPINALSGSLYNIPLIYPDADITRMPVSYPYKEYLNISDKELTFSELVEKYGIPFQTFAGDPQFVYYTSDGYRVLIERLGSSMVRVRAISYKDGTVIYTKNGGLLVGDN